MCRRFLTATLLVALVSVAARAVHTPGFVEPSFYGSSSEDPNSSAIGDLNGDGRPDIVVGSTANTQISVMLNEGMGKFLTTSYSVGSASGDPPEHVVLGDLNQDGKPDVITSDRFNVISVLLNNGDGTFAKAKTYAAAPIVGGLAAGDFNEDGNLDVVVTASSGGSIVVFLGNGDGTLQPASSYQSIAGAQDVAAADLNHDGHLDLVLIGADSHQSSLYGVMLGNGNGTFQTSSSISTVTQFELGLGDLNGDGNLDLILGDFTDFVSVRLGNGDGTFGSQTTYPVFGTPLCVRVADLDGDGKQDVLVGTFFGQDVSVLYGNGDGTLQAEVEYAAPRNLDSVNVADFDDNGSADILVVGLTIPPSLPIAILFSNAKGGFRAPISLDQATDSTVFSLLGDFNNDGVTDIVSYPLGAGVVNVNLGNKDGTYQPFIATTFAPSTIYAAGIDPIATGDFNQDGKLDFAGIDDVNNNIVVVLGKGDGTFLSPVNYPLAGAPTSVAVADFNGDGSPDLAVSLNVVGVVSILLGNGDGTFQSPLNYSAHTIFPNQIGVADFNADGKLDLAITDDLNESVNVLLGRGDGSFYFASSNPAGTGEPLAFAIADLDGDGVPDIAVTGQGSLDLLFSKGNGSFTRKVVSLSTLGITAAATGDFDGDGHPDLALAEISDVLILLNDGSGNFGNQLFRFPPGAHNINIADLNGDGRLDLVNGSDTNVDVMLGQLLPERTH